MATLYMYIIHINDHVSCTLLGVLHRSQVHAARVAVLRCLRFRPDGLLNVRLVGPPGDPLGVHPVDPPDDHPVGRLGDRFGDHPDVRRDGQELPKRRPPESSKSRMFSFWDDLLGTATGIKETQRLCKLL
jgi:hypothetical protein